MEARTVNVLVTVGGQGEWPYAGDTPIESVIVNEEGSFGAGAFRRIDSRFGREPSAVATPETVKRRASEIQSAFKNGVEGAPYKFDTSLVPTAGDVKIFSDMKDLLRQGLARVREADFTCKKSVKENEEGKAINMVHCSSGDADVDGLELGFIDQTHDDAPDEWVLVLNETSYGRVVFASNEPRWIGSATRLFQLAEEPGFFENVFSFFGL